MGLNLSIGRIIFSSLEKYDGKTNRQLTHAEIKQIAGRAGRFKGKYEVCHTKNNEIKSKEKGLVADTYFPSIPFPCFFIPPLVIR